MKFTLAILLVCGLATLRVHAGLARLEAPEDVVVGIYGEPSVGDPRGPGSFGDDVFYRGDFNPVKRAANPGSTTNTLKKIKKNTKAVDSIWGTVSGWFSGTVSYEPKYFLEVDFD